MAQCLRQKCVYPCVIIISKAAVHIRCGFHYLKYLLLRLQIDIFINESLDPIVDLLLLFNSFQIATFEVNDSWYFSALRKLTWTTHSIQTPVHWKVCFSYSRNEEPRTKAFWDLKTGWGRNTVVKNTFRMCLSSCVSW